MGRTVTTRRIIRLRLFRTRDVADADTFVCGFDQSCAAAGAFWRRCTISDYSVVRRFLTPNVQCVSPYLFSRTRDTLPRLASENSTHGSALQSPRKNARSRNFQNAGSRSCRSIMNDRHDSVPLKDPLDGAAHQFHSAPQVQFVFHTSEKAWRQPQYHTA
jgi:hypothetical protein